MKVNIWEYSLLFAVAIPAAIILVGAIINGIQKLLMGIMSSVLGSGFTFVFVNYVMFPGVMLHEISHALMAIITGAKLTEVALFKPSGGTLGYIRYRRRGFAIMQSFQEVLISSAPVYLGGVYICLFLYLMTHVGVFGCVVLWYLSFSMLFHMTMSSQDFKGFFKGVPLFMVTIFVISAAILYYNGGVLNLEFLAIVKEAL